VSPTPEQVDAARLIEAVYAQARARKVTRSIRVWIRPAYNSAGRAVLDSLLSRALQGDPRPTTATVRGQRDLYDRAITTLMPQLAASSRAWALANLNKQELRIGQLRNATQLLTEQLHQDALRATANLPQQLSTMTPENYRALADSRKGRGGTVDVRVRRARYMYAVRQTGNASLLALMAHPRGVTIVDRFAEDAQGGKEYADEAIEECRAAIRDLIGDLHEDSGLIWRLPAAIGPGVWSVGGGPSLAAFALAWGATERSPLEKVLDIAGNATLLLQLAGPVGAAIGDILDVVLAATGTAASFLADLEQDRAALAGAFADEAEKLSQGSRGLGTLLQGATAILAAVAVPGAVKTLVGRSAGAAARVEAMATEGAARAERTDARAVTTGAGGISDAERGLAGEARAGAAPPAKAAQPPRPGAASSAAQERAAAASLVGEEVPAGSAAIRSSPGRPLSGRIPTGVPDTVPAVELRQGLRDRLNAVIAETQETQRLLRRERDALLAQQRETTKKLAAARAAGRGREVDDLLVRQTNLREEIESIGSLSDFGLKIQEARNLLRATEREYFDALTSAASRRETYRSVRKVGKDEVFGLAGELDVEHIFPRSRIFTIPGFERLRWEQQVALFSYRRNLTLMSASANRARGNIRYASWSRESWSVFTQDATVIQRLAEWESQMEAELTAMVRNPASIPLGDGVVNPLTTPVFGAPAALTPAEREIAEEIEKFRKLQDQGLVAPISPLPPESAEDLARRQQLARPQRVRVR
jgi:hypothetical protein